HQRFRGAAARYAAFAAASAPAVPDREPVWNRPRHLLFAAPRPDAAADGTARHPPRDRRLGRAGERAWAALPLGAGVREQGAGDGRVEPAPAWPNLGRKRPAERGAQGGRAPESLSGGIRSPAAARLCGTGTAAAGTHRGRKRRMGRRRAFLGRVAVRGAAVAAPPRAAPARSGRAAARRFGRDIEAPADTLRQPVRDVVPLFDGLARRADRRRRVFPLAATRALLPAAAAFGTRAEVHGRLRDAGGGPARPDAGTGGGTPARPERRALQTGKRLNHRGFYRHASGLGVVGIRHAAPLRGAGAPAVHLFA